MKLQIWVLPKGRSSTTNSGIKIAVLLGTNRSGSFPLLSACSMWTDLKKSEKKFQGTIVEARRVDLANWAFRISPKFTTWVKYQIHQGFDQIRDPEIPITLHPQFLHKHWMMEKQRKIIINLNYDWTCKMHLAKKFVLTRDGRDCSNSGYTVERDASIKYLSHSFHSFKSFITWSDCVYVID